MVKPTIRSCAISLVALLLAACGGPRLDFEVKARLDGQPAPDAKVVVDAKSLEFLDGSTLDYVKEGLKQVFKFTNPNVDATCGCGESFSVKEKA